VVEGRFALDADDRAAVAAIDHDYANCEYTFGRKLDNTAWHRLENGPVVPTYGAVKKDLLRLAAHVDPRAVAPATADPSIATVLSSENLANIAAGWTDATTLDTTHGSVLTGWLEGILHLVDEAE
jgi:hypothetical protein